MTDDLFGDALRRHHRREGDGWVAFERDDERILTQRLDVFFARAPLDIALGVELLQGTMAALRRANGAAL